MAKVLIASALVASLALGGVARAQPDRGAVAAEAAYFEGIEQYRAKDFAGAMATFERALSLGPTARIRSRALLGLTRSAVQLSEAAPTQACGRLDAIGAFVASAGSGAASDKARADVDVLRARCKPPEPVAPPPPPEPQPVIAPPPAPDYTAAWILTASAVAAIGAAVAFEVLAFDAIEARDAAADDYGAARDEAGRIRAAEAVGRHDGIAEVRFEVGYVMGGVGALLAAGALWAWLDPPLSGERAEAGGVSIAPSLDGMWVRMTW